VEPHEAPAGGCVMDISPTLKLSPKVANAALALEALLANGAPDLAVMRARKELRVMAADLKAACEAPQTFRKWTPATPGNAE